jgi:hypothetical protein
VHLPHAYVLLSDDDDDDEGHRDAWYVPGVRPQSCDLHVRQLYSGMR